ncbi:transcription factor Jun [Nematostella vectensis]|uniref:transcription factor Jun n=1 Tax=Nematostella vectensis TaxID=45351 RepID=UPI0020776A49|nr:transcription factor Jun [Nematostella vectensis]
MEESQEATFYQDEGITSHLMPHYLYDKHELHLNLHPVAEDPKLLDLKRNATPSELRSPDFSLLKLASPDIEKMLMSLQSGISASPTPGSLFNSTAHGPVNPTTTEQYSRGFTEALQDLHDRQASGESLIDLADNSDTTDPFLGEPAGNGVFLSTNPATVRTSVESVVYSTNLTRNETSEYFSNTSNIYSNSNRSVLYNPFSTTTGSSTYPTVFSYPPESNQLTGFQDYVTDTASALRGFSPYGNVVKQEIPGNFKLESQTTESGVLQPIDLEIQEVVKRERKKQRNRIASSKCRKRKLEREARLENRVKDLKERNIELNAVANALKQQVCDLKQRVMDHVSEGCQVMLAHQSRMSPS